MNGGLPPGTAGDQRVPPPRRITWTFGEGRFGVGRDHRRAPFDYPAVMAVWILSSWFSLDVLLIWVAAWVGRRLVLSAATRFSDLLQARALGRYHRQFCGCRFETIDLSRIVPAEMLVAFTRSPGNLGRHAVAEALSVTPKDRMQAAPSAFTTFFFMNRPSVILCPVRPEEMTTYQRFILHHELAHALGVQVSHRPAAASALFDLCLALGLLIWVGSVACVWWAGAAYAVARSSEALLSLRRDGLRVELLADEAGYSGIAATEGEEAAARVRVLRGRVLSATVGAEPGGERLARASAALKSELAQQAEFRRQSAEALRRHEEGGGSFVVEERREIGRPPAETLWLLTAAIDRLAVDGPIWRSAYAAAIFASMAAAALIGTGLDAPPEGSGIGASILIVGAAIGARLAVSGLDEAVTRKAAGA